MNTNSPDFKKEESLQEVADRLKSEYANLDDLVVAIGKFIREHADTVSNSTQPQSIIESRFTPAEEAYRKGMMGCGVMANISAEMLRHLGYEIKFIHGECEQSVDHAWISVLDPKDGTWKEYDLTRVDASIPKTHIKKMEVSSWEDIKDQIYSDHETMRERRKQRGMI